MNCGVMSAAADGRFAALPLTAAAHESHRRRVYRPGIERRRMLLLPAFAGSINNSRKKSGDSSDTALTEKGHAN
jgi:hypothetical protein